MGEVELEASVRQAAGLVGAAWRGKPRAELPRAEALQDYKPRVLEGFHLIKESRRFSFYSRTSAPPSTW